MSLRTKLILMVVGTKALALMAAIPILLHFYNTATPNTSLFIFLGLLAVGFIVFIFVASSVADSITNPANKLVNAITAMEQGNFDTPLRADGENEIGLIEYALAKLSDSQKALISGMETQVSSLKADSETINNELKSILSAMQSGELSYRTNNNLGEVAATLNTIISTVQKPIIEATFMAQDLAKGNFSSRISGSYMGEPEGLKTALNKTAELVSEYAEDVSQTLKNISDGRADKQLRQNYQGTFSATSSAVNALSTKFNNLTSQLRTAEDEVRRGLSEINSLKTEMSRPSRLSAPAPRPVSFTPASAPAPRPAYTPPQPAKTATPRSLTPATPPATRPKIGELKAVDLCSGLPPATPTRKRAVPPAKTKSVKIVAPSGAHEYNRRDFGKY